MYTPVWWGASADHRPRAQVRSASNPSGPSVVALMLKVWPALRPPKAVASSATRAIAPPSWKIGKAVSGETIRAACSAVRSMTSSVSRSTSQDLK